MASLPEPDLTCVFYTANVIPQKFAENVKRQLNQALPEGTPLITLYQEGERSHFNIYRQALKGAKMATTKYIALAEDDVLYSPEHFKYRPSPGKFAYNMNSWGIFTWSDPPMFTQKLGGRRNLNSLICERELFIEAIEERFARYPNPGGKRTKDLWAEPSKYERQLKVTVREYETFVTNPPNILFSHETELSFAGLGKRKRVGEIRAYNIPYWGEARQLAKLYEI